MICGPAEKKAVATLAYALCAGHLGFCGWKQIIHPFTDVSVSGADISHCFNMILVSKPMFHGSRIQLAYFCIQVLLISVHFYYVCYTSICCCNQGSHQTYIYIYSYLKSKRQSIDIMFKTFIREQKYLETIVLNIKKNMLKNGS